MFLDWWLGVLLLLLLARTTGGAPLGPEKGPGAPCPSLAGCDSPESIKAPCDDKSCRARAAGEACGVYTPGCARRLRCVPRPGERAPLHALLSGKGVCSARADKKGSRRNQTEGEPAAGDSWRVTHRVGNSTPEPLPLQSQAPLQEVSTSKVQLQQLSLSSDAKHEFDMAPCRMHLATILQKLKASLYVNGEDIFIPNCDTKGFYRRKQCRASKGQKRGQCWCVDKRGHRLEDQEESPLCAGGGTQYSGSRDS